MLPKPNRLDLKRKFSFLKRSGRTYKSPFFVAIYHPAEESKTKIGFVLSKKMGTAVARNRMRRLLAEAFQSRLDSLPPQLDIAIVGRIQLANKSLTEVSSEVERFIALLARSSI